MGISPKQKQILAFSYTNNYQALICDGSVRSGKTSIMTVAFVDWAMREFNNTNFIIGGKTVGSAIKNIVVPYMALTYSRERYRMRFTRSDNRLIVQRGQTVNTFYIYGGKDESSYMLVQGITAAGAFLDEVALQTRSFVEQVLARCLSYKNRRYWFNCNPENPMHWFREEWIQQTEKHRALHLHFLMTDNPALDDDTIADAKRTWSGVFYQRYVLGEWCLAEGLIYPNFNHDAHVEENIPPLRNISISVDVGQSNATVFLATGEGIDNRLYCLDEYYHSGKKTGETKSPLAYSKDFERWLVALLELFPGMKMPDIWIDPSALGFKVQLRDMGYIISSADNDVVPGIQTVSSLIDADLLRVHPRCKNLLDELQTYAWDSKASERGEDKPIKENDHVCDALRYRVFSTKYDWLGRKPRELEDAGVKR